MAYFEWADDLSVGNQSIDDDHRHLIELVNTLHTATCEGAGREVVGGILEQLFTYTQEHFRREEHHMETLKYPGLQEHRRQHDAFLARLHDLQQRYADGNMTVAAQVSALLRDWLSIHIRREDRAIVARRPGR